MEFSPTSIQSIINTCLLVGGIVGGVYLTLRDKGPRIQKDIIETYETRLKQVEEQLSNFRTENKELRDKMNQLIGENKELRDNLALRNPEFEKLIKTLSETMPEVIKRVDKVNKDANDRYENIMEVVQSYLGNLNTHTITTDTITKNNPK
jgi:predicted nuclease with TOPRIM domain